MGFTQTKQHHIQFAFSTTVLFGVRAFMLAYLLYFCGFYRTKGKRWNFVQIKKVLYLNISRLHNRLLQTFLC